MKKSYLFILASTLLILAGIYIYQQRPARVHDEDFYSRLCPSVQSAEEILVWTGKAQTKNALHIKKNDKGWWVYLSGNSTTYPAPAKVQKVRRLLFQISNLQGEKRASGKDILETFHLKDSEALHLLFKRNGKELAHLLAGKRGPRWDSCFVRRNQDDTVYLVSRNLLGLFDIWNLIPKRNPEAAPWVDLTVISQGPEEIEGISYSRGSLEWSLVQNSEALSKKADKEGKTTGKISGNSGTDWILTFDGNVSHKKDADAQKLLSVLFPLEAEKIVPVAKAGKIGLGPGDQYGRLTVHLKGRGMKLLHVGRWDQKQSCGWIRDERGIIFRVRGKILRVLNHPDSVWKSKKQVLNPGSRTSGANK